MIGYPYSVLSRIRYCPDLVVEVPNASKCRLGTRCPDYGTVPHYNAAGNKISEVTGKF